MRKLSIQDIIISVIAVAVVFACLVPAVARLQRDPQDATCQANMRRWAGAVRLYMADWDGCYPTNRIKPSMVLVSQMPLSPQDGDPNNPTRFLYGINWVEALYPYLMVEAQKTGRDWRSVLKCPRASDVKFPVNSQTAAVSYVFNYNLLEQPEIIVRDKSKLMIMREMDRLVGSCCRPPNDSSFMQARVPMSPFLTELDYFMRGETINYNLHGEGSYIVFADGHVAYFGSEYFPKALSINYNWDYETQQWWNWVNKDPALDKAIAITP